MTLVSVVVCTYNSAETLGSALDSALCQTLPSKDYEVLLVDDGSTDQTAELAEGYRENHGNLRYLRLPVNEGLPAACNHGMEAAQGKYFVRLDADDTFDRELLSCCVEPLERDETDLVCCDRYEVTLPGRACHLVEVQPSDPFNLTACGTMLRTDMMRQVGGYRPLFWEEYDLYLRYLQCSRRPPVRIPRPLYHYSRHPSSMTADPTKVRAGWTELKAIWGEEALRRFGWQEPDQEEC